MFVMVVMFVRLCAGGLMGSHADESIFSNSALRYFKGKDWDVHDEKPEVEALWLLLKKWMKPNESIQPGRLYNKLTMLCIYAEHKLYPICLFA